MSTEPNEEQLGLAREILGRFGPFGPDDVDIGDGESLAKLLAARDARLLAERLRPFERIAWELESGTYGGPSAEYMRGVRVTRQRIAKELRAAIEQARTAGVTDEDENFVECQECEGYGTITAASPSGRVETECWSCDGAGKVRSTTDDASGESGREGS